MKLFRNLFLLFIVIFIALTQNSTSKLKSKIIFNDGKKISGVILHSNYQDSLLLKLDGGFQVYFPRNSIKEIKSLRKVFSIGIGMGLSYGFFGLNAEIEPIRQLDFTIGIGTTFFAGVAWDIGVVGYVLDQDYTFRPRLSLIYGTNGFIMLENASNPFVNSSYQGFSIGAGVKSMLGESHGMTIDIFYILSSGVYDKKKELENEGYYIRDIGIPIKFSVGYQFSF